MPCNDGRSKSGPNRNVESEVCRIRVQIDPNPVARIVNLAKQGDPDPSKGDIDRGKGSAAQQETMVDRKTEGSSGSIRTDDLPFVVDP